MTHVIVCIMEEKKWHPCHPLAHRMQHICVSPDPDNVSAQAVCGSVSIHSPANNLNLGALYVLK